MANSFEDIINKELRANNDSAQSSKFFDDAYHGSLAPWASGDRQPKSNLPEIVWEQGGIPVHKDHLFDLIKAQPSVTLAEVLKAEEKLVSKHNPKFDALTTDERQQAMDLELAILRGSFDKFAAQYKDNPDELKKLIDAVKDDLKSAGVEINCQVGNRMNGDDTEMHRFALVFINQVGSAKGVEIATDMKGIATYDGAKSTLDNGADELKRISDQAVRTLNKQKSH
jgi:hypothetical protein